MVVIAISGMPGSGKTTLAISLAKELQIEEIVHTDVLKTFFKCTDPFSIACGVSHNCWKLFGKPTKKNILKGYKEHTNAYEKLLIAYVKEMEKMGKDIIIEGVQISPNIFNNLPIKNKIYFYLTCNPKERKKRLSQKQSRRRIYNPHWDKNVSYMETIDSHIIKSFPEFILNNKNLPKTINLLKEKYDEINSTI